MPFDGDVTPCAFDVIVLGIAPLLLAVQRLDAIFLGSLHDRCPLKAGSTTLSVTDNYLKIAVIIH